MSSLDLSVEPCLFAALFRFVVLLAILEESVRRVVVGEMLGVLLVGDFILGRRAVPRLELFDEFVVGLRSVLALGVVLGALLYAVAILHQSCFLPIPVCPITFGKAGATS
jgi:hypothetical protein